MTEMADDPATTPAEGTAGNQEKTEGTASASDASPFLGKTVPGKPTVNLAGGSSAPNLTPEPSPSTTPQRQPEKINSSAQSAVDALFSGNAVLAAQTPPKASPPPPGPITSLEDPVLNSFGTEEETPLERSRREMGLSPRTVQQKEKAKAVEPEPSVAPRLRTYAMDMSAEIRKRGETLATIVNTEKQQATPDAPPVSPETQRRLMLMAGGAVILVVLGMAVILGVALFQNQQASLPPPHTSLVPANAVTRIDVTKELDTSLASARETSSLNLGEVEELVVQKDGADLSAEEILTAFGAPAALSRNARKIMVGVHAFDRNQPFILVSTGAYDISFEAMLEWEATMPENMRAFFKPTKALSNTPPPLKFSDRVYQNIDTRYTGNDWPIVYAFIRRDLLIITTNENTIKEVLTRLSLSSGT